MLDAARINSSLDRRGSPRAKARSHTDDFKDLGALGSIMQSIDAGIYLHLSEMMADENGDGVVTREEYRHALQAMGYDHATLDSMTDGFEDIALSSPSPRSGQLPPVRMRGSKQ